MTNESAPYLRAFEERYEKFFREYDDISPEIARDIAIDIVTGAIRKQYQKVIVEATRNYSLDPEQEKENPWPFGAQLLGHLEDTLQMAEVACRYALIKETLPKIKMHEELPFGFVAECDKEANLLLHVIHTQQGKKVLSLDIEKDIQIHLGSLISSSAADDLALAISEAFSWVEIDEQNDPSEFIDSLHQEWKEAYQENYKLLSSQLMKMKRYLDKLRYGIQWNY